MIDPGAAPREDTPQRAWRPYWVTLTAKVKVDALSETHAKQIAAMGSAHWQKWEYGDPAQDGKVEAA